MTLTLPEETRGRWMKAEFSQIHTGTHFCHVQRGRVNSIEDGVQQPGFLYGEKDIMHHLLISSTPIHRTADKCQALPSLPGTEDPFMSQSLNLSRNQNVAEENNE